MFWFFGHKACDILAPRPRIQPTPSALEGQVSTYWTAWEVPVFLFLFGHHYKATSSSTLEGKLFEGPVTDCVHTASSELYLTSRRCSLRIFFFFLAALGTKQPGWERRRTPGPAQHWSLRALFPQKARAGAALTLRIFEFMSR